MVEAISAAHGSQIKLSVTRLSVSFTRLSRPIALPLSSCYYCLAPVEVQ